MFNFFQKRYCVGRRGQVYNKDMESLMRRAVCVSYKRIMEQENRLRKSKTVLLFYAC